RRAALRLSFPPRRRAPATLPSPRARGQLPSQQAEHEYGGAEPGHVARRDPGSARLLPPIPLRSDRNPAITHYRLRRNVARAASALTAPAARAAAVSGLRTAAAQPPA